MSSDLRSFLDLLEERGLLMRLPRPVNPATEVGWLMRELEREGVAGLFTDVTGSEFPLVYSLVGTRMALALAVRRRRQPAHSRRHSNVGSSRSPAQVAPSRR